ncbi:hypothetical protein [Flavobacterium sp.]
MTERIEQLYHSVYRELASKLGTSVYKDVDVVPLAIQFYLNTIINSKTFLDRIAKVSDEKGMELLTERYFEGFFKKKKSRLKLAFSDISRYLYHKLFHKVQKSDADYLIFITNKKFFSFVKPVKEALEQKNKKVEFLVWDKNDALHNAGKVHLPITRFPSVMNKWYPRYHDFTSLIDRAHGFLPLLQNKKLILIEGDLESHHILGHLAKKHQFKTYCLQWGFFVKTVTKPGWRNMPFDKFLVWGDFFKDKFEPYNSKLDIVACGHPSLKETIVTEKGKAILFAVQKESGEHITKEEVLDFIHFGAKIALQLTDYKIIIRSHPDFDIPENIRQEYRSVSNIIWHDYKNVSLNQSFEEAKYCVSISSTVSLESIAFGCYPLYLKVNSIPLQIHQMLSGYSQHRHVFDAGNFLEGIQYLETQDLKNYLSDFRDKLYTTLGSPAVKRIVSELET